MVLLGKAELKANHIPEALRDAESAVAGERTLLDKNTAQCYEHQAVVFALILAAEANDASGDFEHAEKLLREAQDRATPMAQGDEPDNLIPLANVETVLGKFYVRHRRIDQARACFQDVLDLWKKPPGSNIYIDHQKSVATRLLASLRN